MLFKLDSRMNANSALVAGGTHATTQLGRLNARSAPAPVMNTPTNPSPSTARSNMNPIDATTFPIRLIATDATSHEEVKTTDLRCFICLLGRHATLGAEFKKTIELIQNPKRNILSRLFALYPEDHFRVPSI